MRLTKDSKISFTPQCLTVNGRPWYPVMGEMHYSRVPVQYWEDELCKMKAGGVDIVSLYTIWIHHEEEKGVFDFTGSRDLHAFLETVKRCGLYAILRIGPWAHGEARNGGFPDWLLEAERSEGFRTRTDDAGYLHYVQRFYEHIYHEAQGELLQDNGPVIGVQIENEYGHVGGQRGAAGEQHMRTLHDLAVKTGFSVPIYTATGWGGAVTGGMLPVMGGYCEAPWDQRLTEIEPSGNYVFTAERNDHGIGSDHGIGEDVTFDYEKFPFLTAELGGGLQVTRHRRCIASGKDTGVMSMVKLGSGANLLGYYMYHGGTNPKGKFSTLQETRATGYPNDLPVLSYDFNAPLREYGQMEDAYRYIRRLSLFVHDFGEDLCTMDYVEQPGNTDKAEDLESLRTAVRCRMNGAADGSRMARGYLFVNNYQRRYSMAEHLGERLSAYVPLPDTGLTAAVTWDDVDIVDGDSFFWPFNLPVGDKALIRKAFATPLCILHGSAAAGGDVFVFYTKGRDAASADSISLTDDTLYEIEGDLDGNEILTITEEESLRAQKITGEDGREYLVIAEGNIITDADGRHSVSVYAEGGTLHVNAAKAPADAGTEPGACAGEEVKAAADIASEPGARAGEGATATAAGSAELRIYPEPKEDRMGAFHKVKGGSYDATGCSMAQFTTASQETDRVNIFVEPSTGDEYSFDIDGTTEYGMTGRPAYFTISVDRIPRQPAQIYLNIDYFGFTADLRRNGELIADNFYTGQTWEIGLGRFIDHEGDSEHGKRRDTAFTAELGIEPLTKDTKVYLQQWPGLTQKIDGHAGACRIEKISAVYEYRLPL
jgi:beta-galactosidase